MSRPDVGFMHQEQNSRMAPRHVDLDEFPHDTGPRNYVGGRSSDLLDQGRLARNCGAA